MGLWVTFYDGPPDQVEEACRRAEIALQQAEVSATDAQEAAIVAADLAAEDYDGPTPNDKHVVAWYEAEYEALAYLQSQDNGEWPNGAALIYVDQGE
ncbi:hypothetical protein J3A72_000480 [Stenotrophomonas sp. PvP093]|uniref:hypothetical protein n=1 Tax=unclassified Stenotrophomonas TaxID=196198 RepID=UPI001AEA4226|nr:hypothetical protein [Stenotrophomonas sp. PvP093]MBP2480188.1 hypothetical protein [Stenotrophomonas sp. PvP093]